MLFDTPIYFVFLTIVVDCYWRLPRGRQNVLLLGASYLLYGWWDCRALGLILLSTLVDYVCAHLIGRSDDPIKRRMALIVSIGLNLGFLGFFKYFNFFIDSFSSMMSTMGLPVSDTTLQILLP